MLHEVEVHIHEFSILAKQIEICSLDPVDAVFRPMVVLVVNIAPDVMICVIYRNSETYFMNRMLTLLSDVY